MDKTNKKWILVDVLPAFRDENDCSILGKKCKISVFPLK